MAEGGTFAQRRTLLPFLLALAIAGLASLQPASASAAPSQFLEIGELGSGPGQLNLGFRASGVATDPATGHVFVADNGNDRVTEFTAWGEFVKSWGSTGSGPGQFLGPNGIALEDGGVYVFERRNHRVQKFNSAGEFLLMFGGGVDHTSGADTCTKADEDAGDVCGAGEAGSGPGEFSIDPGLSGVNGNYIAAVPGGGLYVADEDRIQKFSSAGAVESQIPLPEKGNPGALAVDPASGDLYFAFDQDFGTGNPGVYRISPAGLVLDVLPTSAAEALATDSHGNVYAVDDPALQEFGVPELEPRVLVFDPDGNLVESCCALEVPTENSGTQLPALATNTVTAAGGFDLYVAQVLFSAGIARLAVFGPPPDKWPPPAIPPTIDAEYALSPGTDSMAVQARVNPQFWADTRYFVEFGTEDCAAGGCKAVPAGPGFELGAGIVKSSVRTKAIRLLGLEPASTYHYRFVAQSGGGGPVFGPDRTFETLPLPAPARTDCPNQAFRKGAGATLPDCRAYEMVSPVDKQGGDIAVQCNINCFPARLDQSAANGDSVTYSSYRSFAGAPSAPYSSQYMARRGADGWTNEPISPPREGVSALGSLQLETQYKAFQEDLSQGWIVHDANPLLAPGAVAGFADLYRRTSASGAYEALSTVPPPNTKAAEFLPELQGFSADGLRAVFRAKDKLTANASGKKDIFQLYEAFEGGLRLVSVRPNGSAAADSSALGGGVVGFDNGRRTNVAGAVSTDGSRIFWTETESKRLFVRIDGTQTKAVSTGAARFWAATPDGSKVLYSEGETLKAADVDSGESEVLAGGFEGVAGASADLSKIYFASTAALAGGAVAGQPNLYLEQAGQPLKLVATLSSRDLPGARSPSPVALDPSQRVARVSADGNYLVFMSRAGLLGGENLDAASDEPDAQVYRYDATEERLLCISCGPAGVRPAGRELEYEKNPAGYWAAAQIPAWESQFHASRVLSADGQRVFFESFAPLVASDSNEAEDVYEWEAPGAGECTEAAGSFSADAGGCLSLVSDGVTPRDVELIDASADGRDVFFTTPAGLVGGDQGQIDLYDAREGGGFPEPPPSASECSGESCQEATPSPPTGTPTSEGFEGPGNDKEPAKPRKPRRHKKHAKRGKHRRHRAHHHRQHRSGR